MRALRDPPSGFQCPGCSGELSGQRDVASGLYLIFPSIATQVRWPTIAWLQQHPRDSSRQAKLGSVPVHLDCSAHHLAARSAGAVTFVIAIMKEIGATQPSQGPLRCLRAV